MQLNNHTLSRDTSTGEEGELQVDYTSLRSLTIRHAGLYTLELENSDGFLNIARLSVSSWARLVRDVQSHGLIGQTWRSSGAVGEQVAEVEGRVDDYVEADGQLLGCNTKYNRFAC